ncbi:helix-turn-helix transcriptional regulator [Amycolatopsis cihanbeyliensis]
MVGRSTSWLDKIENGERSLLRLPMLERVAEALSVDPSALTDGDTPDVRCTDAVEVEAIKKALGRYPMLTPGSGGGVVPADVHRQLRYAGYAWLASHLATVGQVLPRLLIDAQAVASQAAEADRAHAHRALVMAYRLACSMLLKHDATDIAWLAADRAMHAARCGDDTIALARATRSVARAMSHVGQFDESVAAATGMADLLRPYLGNGDADTVPLFGMLLLSAEITASRQGNGSLAGDLHQEAVSATGRLAPEHRDHHTVFGPANVQVHRVSALVRLREGKHAIRYADTIEPSLIACLPSERQSNYLLDLTDAYTQTGSYRNALRVLIQADQLAPQEVRCRPLARRLISGLLLTNPGGADAGLRRIAHKAGVNA